MLNGLKTGSKYSEEVRMFSLNMRFLSPRAYQYLRQKFDLNLPHAATIRKWFSFSNSGGNAGFTDTAFQILKKMSEEYKAIGKPICVSLAFDEMAIRTLVQWHHHLKKFGGFINFGTKEFEEDALPIAKNALVIMLNGINVKLTIPIAYFFITTLIAEEKSIFIASVVKALTNIGIKVVNMTSDGLIANFAAYEILGAKFASDEIVPYFQNVDNGQNVYVIHDAPHLIKLARNCLSDQKVLHDRLGRPVEWKFIERLYRYEKGELCAHKLTKRHIDWKTAPMKVVLAAQTLSMSVAQSIKKLSKSGESMFDGSDGTVEFIERMDKTFNLFNSDTVIDGNIYKSPINQNTKASIFSFMDDMIDYIDGLTLQGKPITKTQRSTAFTGFKSNMMALKHMYQDLVETKTIETLPTTSIQQDFLESFFGRMRSGNGCNTNPSQEQFCANFRKTLINRELTCSALSNCIDKLDILTVSSTDLNRKSEGTNFIMRMNLEIEEFHDENQDDVPLDELATDVPCENDNERTDISASTSLGVMSVAGIIEARIEKSRNFKCALCAKVFEENEKNNPDLFVKTKKNILPCKSTFTICELSNSTMNSYFALIHESHFEYEKVFNAIRKKLLPIELYCKTDFEHNPDHKRILIAMIIEEFIRIRATHRARQITLDAQTKLIRSAKIHDIHFAGQ